MNPCGMDTAGYRLYNHKAGNTLQVDSFEPAIDKSRLP